MVNNSVPTHPQFVSDGQQFVANAPQFVSADQKVLPVDIAGTSISADTNQAAMELAQKSQIEGAYAANNSDREPPLK